MLPKDSGTGWLERHAPFSSPVWNVFLILKLKFVSFGNAKHSSVASKHTSRIDTIRIITFITFWLVLSNARGKCNLNSAAMADSKFECNVSRSQCCGLPRLHGTLRLQCSGSTASSGVTGSYSQERQFLVFAFSYTCCRDIFAVCWYYFFICLFAPAGPSLTPVLWNDQVTPRYCVYEATWSREQPTELNKTVHRKRGCRAKGKAGLLTGLTQQEKKRQHCRTRQRSFLPLFPSARSSPHQPFISRERSGRAQGVIAGHKEQTV